MKRFKMWAVIAAVALVIVVSTAGCTSNTGNQTPSAAGSQAPSASQMITYSSGNFTIQHPSDWTNYTPYKGNMLDSMTYYSPDKTAGLKALFSNYTSMTLSSYTAARLAANVSNQNYTQLSAGNATLAGNPAYKIVYTATSWLGGDLQKMTEIFTVKDGKVYSVTYGAYPKNYDAYADTFQKMTDSFQIK
jgi:hypothetical protein